MRREFEFNCIDATFWTDAERTESGWSGLWGVKWHDEQPPTGLAVAVEEWWHENAFDRLEAVLEAERREAMGV